MRKSIPVLVFIATALRLAAQIEVISGGSVGVGTSSPTGKFDIRQDGIYNDYTVSALNLTTVSSPLSQLRMGFDLAVDGAYLQSVRSGVAVKPLLLNAQGGNVGIGTTSPAGKLEALGGNGSYIYSTATQSGYTWAGFYLKGYGGSTSYSWALQGGSLTGGAANQFGLYDGTAGAHRLWIDGSGNLGVGLTSPAYKLDVNGSVNASHVRAGYFLGTGPLVSYDSASGGLYMGFTSGGSYIRSVADNSGNAASLVVQIGNGNDAITVSAARAIRFNAYGAGSLSTDSSGNITATSDARAKDTVGDFTTGLAAVRQLKPKKYHWKKSTGLNTEDLNVSVYAQDLIAAGVPEAVSAQVKPKGDGQADAAEEPGLYTVSDRAVISVLINAAKELAARNDALEARIAGLELKLKDQRAARE